jgi:hypothetical protein
MKNVKKWALSLTVASLAILVSACGATGTTTAATTTDTSSDQTTTVMTDTSEASTEATTEASTEATSESTTIALSDTVYYDNSDYGFTFHLPESWDGYTVLEDQWTATPSETNKTGPEIILRSPNWTESSPTQDIPILVFTHDEWDAVQAETFNVSAAPIPPTLIGENSSYVFALPARYNFAFPEGFEEVEAILNSNPMTTYEIN